LKRYYSHDADAGSLLPGEIGAALKIHVGDRIGSRSSGDFGLKLCLVNISATLVGPFGPSPTHREDRMAGFIFRLEHEDGTPADPPTFHAAGPKWRPGDQDPARAPKPAGRRRQGRRR
jgi:hypothetical protein